MKQYLLGFIFFLWTILKVFTEFVTALLLFHLLVFWLSHLVSQLPDQGLNLIPPSPYIGRQSLSHWTIREVVGFMFWTEG